MAPTYFLQTSFEGAHNNLPDRMAPVAFILFVVVSVLVIQSLLVALAMRVDDPWDEEVICGSQNSSQYGEGDGLNTSETLPPYKAPQGHQPPSYDCIAGDSDRISV